MVARSATEEGDVGGEPHIEAAVAAVEVNLDVRW
jgi:hypothetical protein